MRNTSLARRVLPWAAASTALFWSVLALSKRARARWMAALWLRSQHACEALLRPRKQALLSEVTLRGTVLDVGTGAGVRLRYLALVPDVTCIVCVEPNEHFRAALESEIEAVQRRRRADWPESAPLTIEVVWATVESFVASSQRAAATFDAVTCFLVLCSIPDPLAAIAALHDHCLKPGGILVFVEHVKPQNSALATIFALVQPAWTLLSDGCQLCRSTANTVARAAPWAAVRSSVHFPPEEDASSWSPIPAFVPWTFGVAEKKTRLGEPLVVN